ncbi:hypothetical protein QDT05_03060 [Acinetobacter baumannii]|uniref:hypothetical protein n=1 Tax=Acinetobacter baumannii TaxID=470 RepID=UPI00244BDF39|nr:hypothetical protein [Acinetobacter baumannii]MDH2601874.1 hypothetical protein [Acinetobacter baumannii]
MGINVDNEIAELACIRSNLFEVSRNCEQSVARDLKLNIQKIDFLIEKLKQKQSVADIVVLGDLKDIDHLKK